MARIDARPFLGAVPDATVQVVPLDDVNGNGQAATSR